MKVFISLCIFAVVSVNCRTLRDVAMGLGLELTERQAYGSYSPAPPPMPVYQTPATTTTAYTTPAPTTTTAYITPAPTTTTQSYSAPMPSYGSSSMSSSSSPSTQSGTLSYVYGYPPPPPSVGKDRSGPYMLYQGLAPGMVIVPINQLNQMFAAGAMPLNPLSDSASMNYVPASSSMPSSSSSSYSAPSPSPAYRRR